MLADGKVIESTDDILSGNPFILTDKPHPKKVEGYPLDRISLHIGTGKYYYDLSPEDYEMEECWSGGWQDFFKKALNL